MNWRCSASADALLFLALLALAAPSASIAQLGRAKATPSPAVGRAPGRGKSSPGILPSHLASRLATGTQMPDFSWTLQPADPAARDLTQSAYEIRLTPADSRRGAATWDSGKTESTAISAIPYAGPELASHSRYRWQVRVWDGNEQASPWSQAATLTTTLRLSDWKAHWIGFPDVAPQPAAAPLPILRHTFAVAARPVRALLFLSGLGQYSARLNGQQVGDALITPGWTDYHKRIFYNTYDVTKLLKPSAPNAIGVLLGNGMYNVEKTPGRYTKFTGSDGPPKLIAQLHISYSDGASQVVATDRAWKIAASPFTFSSVYGGEDFDSRLVQPGWDTATFDDTANPGWDDASEVPSPGGVLVAEPMPPIRLVHTFSPVKTTHPSANVTVFDLGQNFVGWPAITATGPAGATIRLLCGELLDAKGNVTQRSANAFPKIRTSIPTRSAALHPPRAGIRYSPRGVFVTCRLKSPTRPSTCVRSKASPCIPTRP